MLVFAGEKVTKNSSVRKQFIGERVLTKLINAGWQVVYWQQIGLHETQEIFYYLSNLGSCVTFLLLFCPFFRRSLSLQRSGKHGVLTSLTWNSRQSMSLTLCTSIKIMDASTKFTGPTCPIWRQLWQSVSVSFLKDGIQVYKILGSHTSSHLFKTQRSKLVV